jgi:hypothetical protein
MRPRFVAFMTVATLAAGTANGQNAPTAASGAATPPSPVVVVGCLQRAQSGDGFTLQASARATTQPAATTGTSVTGEAPSGAVTGQTPTGATATEAASPTPAVGTPPATANPASPTYNQPAPRGISGSASTTGTAAAPNATIYRLEAGTGVSLREHAGHTVEIRGTVSAEPGAQPCCAGVQGPTARSHEPEADQPIGTTSDAVAPTGRDAREPAALVLMVTAVRHVAATCER